MHHPPSAIQPASESQARYNLQATEDIDEYHNELDEKKHSSPIPTRPDYRPKPLQWPFIVCMVLVLSVFVGLVIYARNTMPNSDSTAIIEPRQYLGSRQEPSSINEKSSSPSLTAQASSSSESGLSSERQQSTIGQISNADLPTTSGPGRSPASESTTAATVTISSSGRASSAASGISTQQDQSSTSEFTSTFTRPGSTFQYTTSIQTTRTDVISDNETTYYQTTTKTVGRVTTSTSAVPASTVVEVTSEVGEATITSTAQFTSPARVSTYSSIVVSAVPTTIASVATSTAAGVVYVSVGTTEITRVVTIPGGSRDQQSEQPNPVTQLITSVFDGKVVTVVKTGKPQPTTFITSISGKLSTITSTPKPSTRISTIGPSTAVFTSVSLPASTSKPDTVITEVEKFTFTDGDYFLGKFLPVILAVMIAIPLRIIDLNAKLYQPFHALSQEGGALGKNSMTIQFEGWNGFLAPFKVLRQGHPVPFITTLIVWSSSLLAPLATEAIGMKLHGKCKITAIDGCGIQLGVSPKSAYILIALLILIVALLLVLLYLLRSWKTGLHANPWSIGGISSLSLNAEIRPHHVNFKATERTMADKNYMLGFFENRHGRDEYGIIYYDESADNLQSAGSGALSVNDDSDIIKHPHNTATNARTTNPFIALTYWWRIVFISFLLALFIIILYYHVTLGLRTSFKDFMDSQTFGLRFFLAALGVIIIFCWESIFISVAIVSPYYHMRRRSQRPESSILLTRPTNGFYGIYAAIINGDIVLMLAAFMSIIAEFLPMLLANVPYNLTQTLNSHNVCSIISLTILVLMIVAVGASLFIKWPEMPVDPRSIAGAMYYVNESRMLDDFGGLSHLSSLERKKKVGELGRRYFYGALTGRPGRRMGVESVESVEDTVYTGANWLPSHDDSGECRQEASPYRARVAISPEGDPAPKQDTCHEERGWV
ncbi:uncharacterized protein BDZ83DRAFT_595907 [Colletotrichum acutatum]|uniref:Uncharacterized protein n=1 Tax=Glomerella acutata TaxID=27357 RepID=A0AAD8XAP0_GLOAC|nr:uncharacterized protein BDZ83DRAFT_595907 [Colletotrichum acutatum]KAK1701747.1 hypothetical protein BDZ83DRAFT_595907 [Colletotrichum acutatum]